VAAVSGQPRQAREALGARLREIRLDAELTARELAKLAGWHFTKVSKLEHGTRPPSPDDIRAWCKYCRAENQAIDLIATARRIDAMYAEWRRLMRAGMKHYEDSLRPLYEQTSLFRAYETTFIPSLLNTAAYAGAILESRSKPFRRDWTSPSPPRSASMRRSSTCCNARQSTASVHGTSSRTPWPT
jgi:transcriptional regulator with XRE-family HTH domain